MKDSEEFELFYESHAPKVRGLLYRLVGEAHLADLTQETFLKAWQARGQFRNESSTGTWIYRIAHNCAVDFLRKNKIRPVMDSAGEVGENKIEKQLSYKEIAQIALQSLTVEHRTVAILFYFEDLSLEEIGKALKIPVGTVKSRLSFARTTMNDLLTKKGLAL